MKKAFFLMLTVFVLLSTMLMMKLSNDYYSKENFKKMFMTLKHMNLFKNYSIPLSKVKFQQWTTVPNGPEDDWSVTVFDSFYDSRINKTVIFLASQTADMIEIYGQLYKYFCIYFDSKGTYIETVSAHFYTSYMLYCKNSTTGIVPNFLSLIRNDSVQLPDWLIPVRHFGMASADKSPKTFAMCVGILFGNQPWLTLIQFIEFHRMQGVEKFFMFYHDLRNPTTRKIFSYYMKNYANLIELIEWAPKTKYCSHYWCQLLRDNYCLYSNINKYKYLGFVDIDELLYPVNDNVTVLQLLQNTDRSYIGSFTFRVKWYQTLRETSPFYERVDLVDIDRTVRKYLPLLQYTNVSTLVSELYSPKTVLKPERVLRKWIHFVREHVPGSVYYFMNETQAHLIHFKVRNWWGDFADKADQVANFTIVDPYRTFGEKMINDIVSRVAGMAKNVKLSF